MKRLMIAALVALPVVLGGFVGVGGAHTTSATPTATPTKLTICHKTGSGSDAWRRITVSGRAVANPKSSSGRLLRGHMGHTGDAIVVGTGACPSASLTLVPSATAPAKLTICHKTGSSSNPYRRITVSSRAIVNLNSKSGKTLRGHMGHEGDLLLPGASGCPSGSSGGQGQGVKLTANLQPVTGATGSGTATITIRQGQGELCYTLTVSGLTNVTAAHIHRVSTGAVVVPLTAPTSGSSSGCVTVDKTLLQEIRSNAAAFYVNVHTTTFPNGQVRGGLTK